MRNFALWIGEIKMIEENNKTTSQGIEYLRKIGVERIKEDTHLDTIKIVDILEKRFDRLDSVRAKGFIYILEKEYHLDLSDWLEEYYLAHPQMDNEEEEKREHYSNKVRQKKIVFYLCVLGVCVVLGILIQIFSKSSFAFFDSKKQVDAIQSNANAQNPSEVLIQQESQENSHEAKNQTPFLRQENDALSKKDEEKKAERLSLDKPIYELGTPVFGSFAFDSDNVLELGFLKPVWVGVVFLDSKKRTAKINKEFSIQLDRELLIYIAYGSFTASLNGDEKEFATYKPIFLLYSKEGGLREITKEEFVILNGGIEW